MAQIANATSGEVAWVGTRKHYLVSHVAPGHDPAAPREHGATIKSRGGQTPPSRLRCAGMISLGTDHHAQEIPHISFFAVRGARWYPSHWRAHKKVFQ